MLHHCVGKMFGKLIGNCLVLDIFRGICFFNPKKIIQFRHNTGPSEKSSSCDIWVAVFWQNELNSLSNQSRQQTVNNRERGTKKKATCLAWRNLTSPSLSICLFVYLHWKSQTQQNNDLSAVCLHL